MGVCEWSARASVSEHRRRTSLIYSFESALHSVTVMFKRSRVKRLSQSYFNRCHAIFKASMQARARPNCVFLSDRRAPETSIAVVECDLRIIY